MKIDKDFKERQRIMMESQAAMNKDSLMDIGKEQQQITDEYRAHIERKAMNLGKDPGAYFRERYEGNFIDEGSAKKASHEELCNSALKTYNEIADHASHHDSTIPKAIRFYRDHWGDVNVTRNARKKLDHIDANRDRYSQVEKDDAYTKAAREYWAELDEKKLLHIDVKTLLSSPSITLDDDHEWGYQVRMVNNAVYCAKLLVLTNGIKGSRHYHENKNETFICLAGEVLVDTATPEVGQSLEVETTSASVEPSVPAPDDKMMRSASFLKPGDKRSLPSGTIHQMWALEYPAVILEVSTHDDDEDAAELARCEIVKL